MKKFEGILKISVTKKGEKKYHIDYSDDKGKPKKLELKNLDLSACKDGDSCAIEMEDNKIINCFVEGRKISGGFVEPSVNKPEAKSGKARDVLMGFGPYNFSCYKPGLVLPPFTDEERKWSGKIVCELKALTPLLVGGKHEKNEDGSTTCRFMQVAGKNVIPGTSLKGMLRSVMEILSYSGMRPMNRKKLFWRDVTDKEHYTSVFGEKLQGGFLRQHGADYEIVEVEVEKEAPKQLKEYRKLETGPKVGKDRTPNYYYFKLPAEADYKKATSVDSGVVDRFRDQMTPFQEDKYPAEKRKKLMEGKPGLPVFFYKNASGKIMELGFCRYFRLQYKYSPYHLAWPDEEMRDVEDVVRGIFGYTGKAGKSTVRSLAGRVAVGALVLEGNEYMPGKGLEVILGGPKPTCVPFYLQQDLKKIKKTEDGKKNNLYSMVNYNNKSARLRGRKLYWHHEPDITYLNSIEKKTKKVVSFLRPLAAGAHGIFNIHIKDLSDSELGCLLEALELKNESAHKLGMGRPLGLGSVRVRIKQMNVENTAQKYASLAARLGNAERPEMYPEEREKLREKFRNRVFAAVKEAGAAGGASQYYHLEAIKDLFMILDWQRQPDPSEVEYMTLKEYMKNEVLPDPENVRKKP